MNESFENECTSLDDYLDRELAGEAALRFEAHLANCAACRDAVAQQQWIDAALRSSVAKNPVAPATLQTALSDSIAAATQQQRQRRLLTASFAVAASVAIVATIAWRILPLAPGSARGSLTTPHNVAQRDGAPGRSPGLEEPAQPREQVKTQTVARFTAGVDGIAIPIASESPEVTIVQFYSTTDADRRMQRQRELEAKYQELIGG
ncbi:anti-sigma factor family protein [Lacipirellula sp.]|uniref:anti-sigma factor family protein n=1 Tax=Lacipirellula sp. TaxID=2691419 RepID=UPI003D0D9B01